MWDLICYHAYIWGTIAADRSRWHSDGLPYGVAPLAGGGLRFSTPQSRVTIPRRNGDPWGAMGALRVEIVASSQQGGGTIVDADSCFRVSFDGPQTIVVEILGYTLNVAIMGLPLGNWVRFTFWHDGVNQLDYDYAFALPNGGFGGSVLSPTNLPGQVPAVGAQGVWIGNRIGSPNNHLNGNISSVKIWRADPDAIITTFLGRPFTPPVLKCWGDMIGKISEVAGNDPVCARWLADLIEQQQNQLVARLGQKSPDKLAEFYRMCNAYQQLWSGGKVGSAEMQALMVRLRDWLKNEGIFSADDPDLRATLQNPCIGKFAGAAGGLDCDPDAQALIKAILGVGNQH
jgi:hypothetical protein